VGLDYCGDLLDSETMNMTDKQKQMDDMQIEVRAALGQRLTETAALVRKIPDHIAFSDAIMDDAAFFELVKTPMGLNIIKRLALTALMQHGSLSGAVARVREMIAAKRKSIAKQLAKLDEIEKGLEQ
jgi:hypothetical protein